MNNKVNLFDLDVYIENNEEITRIIKEALEERNLTIRKISRDINLSNQTIYHFLRGNSMRSKNLRKIIDFLEIDPKLIENALPIIYSGPCKYFKYSFKFPLELSPLHIRVVSHFLGDSCLEKDGCRWTQKSDMGGENMIKLIEMLVNFKINKGTKNAYGIPILLGDIVAKSLDLKRAELNSSLFVKKVNSMSTESRVQLLAAFIVDEGHIRKSTIQIVNADLELLKELKILCDSLGYNCSEIKTEKQKGQTRLIKGKLANVNHDSHVFFIYADGLLKLKEDLDKIIKKYGPILNLWQKQEDLNKYSKLVDLNKVYKRRATKQEIIPLILDKVDEGPLIVSSFAKENNLSSFRAGKIFHRLEKRGKIKRIFIGMYARNDYNGPIPKTIKQKILGYFEFNTKFSLRSISDEIDCKLKCVSSQLTRLRREGIINRIGCGLYEVNQ